MIKRKITSLFLGIAMLCSMLVPVHAQTDINITFAAQKDGAFIFVPQSVTVADGIAEDYGYSMPQSVDYPTFLTRWLKSTKKNTERLSQRKPRKIILIYQKAAG